MCGIAGTFGSSWTDFDFHELFKAIRHRGPDASGVSRRGSLRLGMHRLHLRGDTCTLPVTTQHSLASFNGQIYSASNGGQHKTPFGLIEEIQSLESTPDSVDGMFASSLIDLKTAEVSLLVDPFFIKPLFYRREAKSTAVCSELAPLARLRSNSIHFDALAELFSFGWPLSDSTWLAGIEMVARKNVRINHGDIVQLPKPTQRRNGTVAPTSEVIRRSVAESVRNCTEGSGPFGLAVSGGIDSSILAWELNAAGIENLVTVSVRLPEEDDGIESLAELGLPAGGAWTTWKHRCVVVDPRELFLDLTRSVIAFGQPTTMSSLPLSQYLADAAHEEGVRVMITGEGADELFAGYSSYSNLTPRTSPLNYYSNTRREALVRTLFGSTICDATRDRFQKTYASYCDLRDIEIEMRLARLLLRTDVTLMSRSIEGRTPFLHSGIPALALALSWDDARANGGKRSLRMAYRDQLGALALKPKTRFRLTDVYLSRLLRQHHVVSLIRTELTKIFGAANTNRALSLVLTEDGFDADFACLSVSLAVLLESGVLS